MGQGQDEFTRVKGVWSKPTVVSKIRVSDRNMAADLFIYVDNARLEEESWQAMRQVASSVNSLGIQEAARKRRWGIKRPGAWAGSIIENTEAGVYVMVLQEKWDKCSRYIGEIVGELRQSRDDTLEFKPLERKRVFFIYVTRTFPSMVPYLKGIHQTLDTWRPNQRESGWKLTPKEIKSRMSTAGEHSEGPREMELPPERVKAAPCAHWADNKLNAAKGNYTLKPLFDLMLRLRKMEMKGQLLLHVVHVAGMRMIKEGVDGGSRGI
jgi:hypothetical protein